MAFILKLVINAAALYAATRFVDGISWTGDPKGIAGVALVFAVINSILKPLAKFFALPLIFLTLGLFTVVINAGLLILTSRIAGELGLGFYVRDFSAAFWGAICVSIVSMVLNAVIEDDKRT